MPRTGTGPFPALPRAGGGGTGPGERPPGIPWDLTPRQSPGTPRDRWLGGDPPGPGPAPPAGRPAVPGTGWPLRSELEFGPFPGAVPSARLHTRLVLWEWGQLSLADTVELIVSELMTNALRATAAARAAQAGYPDEGLLPTIGLRLASDHRQVLTEVWDGSPAPPAPGSLSADGETGRGLFMVQAVSRRWGYYYPAGQQAPAAAGRAAVKVVWALVTPAQAR